MHVARKMPSLVFGMWNLELWSSRIISISRGKSEGSPEGAKRPTAGDEPREFTSRGEGGRVPPFFEKLRSSLLHRLSVRLDEFWEKR